MMDNELKAEIDKDNTHWTKYRDIVGTNRCCCQFLHDSNEPFSECMHHKQQREALERALAQLQGQWVSELIWTTETPKEVGYYWFKNGGNAMIVDVFNHDGSMRFMIDGLYPGVGVEMVGSIARWSDKPLPLPSTEELGDECN